MTDTRQALPPSPTDDRAQEDVVLTPLLNAVWRHRRDLKIGLSVTLAAFVAVAIILRLALPTERFGKISFRIEMEGAASGEYPNGTKFSAEEIVATPVLMRVYEVNDVQRYTEFGKFASAFLIENSSPQRDALTREYQAKLSDTRLTPVDRSRLEAEFQDKLNALNTPEYRLSLRQFTSGPQLPNELVNKILQDTLRTWAQFAGERKGALFYNIPVMGRGALNWEHIARGDYLPGLDILRIHVMKVLDTLDLFRAKLPGADAVRIGPNRMTLEEIRSVLENLLRFTIEPLAGTVGSKDPAAVRLYVESQLHQTRMQRDEISRRAAGLDQSLQQYSAQSTVASGTGTITPPASGFPRGQANNETLIPQVGESFLDRLMQMSSRKEEVIYRQGLIDRLIAERFLAAKLEREVAYYEALSRVRAAAASGGAADRAPIEARLKAAFDEVSAAVDQVVMLHEQLAKNNLNPSTVLYTVTLPYTHERVAAFTVQQALLWGLALMIAMFFVLVLTLLLYDRFHHRFPTVRRVSVPTT